MNRRTILDIEGQEALEVELLRNGAAKPYRLARPPVLFTGHRGGRG